MQKPFVRTSLHVRQGRHFDGVAKASEITGLFGGEPPFGLNGHNLLRLGKRRDDKTRARGGEIMSPRRRLVEAPRLRRKGTSIRNKGIHLLAGSVILGRAMVARRVRADSPGGRGIQAAIDRGQRAGLTRRTLFPPLGQRDCPPVHRERPPESLRRAAAVPQLRFEEGKTS